MIELCQYDKATSRTKAILSCSVFRSIGRYSGINEFFPGSFLTVKFLSITKLEILHEEKRDGVSYALKMQQKPELTL